MFSNKVNAQEAEGPTGEPAQADVAGNVSQPESPQVADVTDAAEGAQDAKQEQPATEVALPEEIVLDQTVAVEDLGAKFASVLPGDFLHGFKRFGRAVAEALTFDPIKDAELKIQHANQELVEINQLIEEKGMENVEPEVLKDSLDYFNNKMASVKDVAGDLKAEAPRDVENFLVEQANQQIKQQKVWDEMAEQAVEMKQSNPELNDAANGIFTQVDNASNGSLENFGEILTNTVGEEKIQRILTDAVEMQEGSDFRHLKSWEVLNELKDKVPETAKDAIRMAQENTVKYFEQSMKNIPLAIRADKLKDYAKYMRGDESRHLEFLNDLKASPEVPDDVLQAIESVKEFTVRRFEDKIQTFGDRPDIGQSFLQRFEDGEVEDMLVLEELKNKMQIKEQEMQNKMKDVEQKSLKMFADRFTDTESKNQFKLASALFEKARVNPSPQVFAALESLRKELEKDPEKAKFLSEVDNMEKEATNSIETGFRKEGEKFFDRMATLDPRDMEFFEGVDSLPQELVDKFKQMQVNNFKNFAQDVESPEMFDRFYERFADDSAKQFVNTVKEKNPQAFKDLGDAMQYKSRKMEGVKMDAMRQAQEQLQRLGSARLDFEERETRYQIDRLWKDHYNKYDRMRNAAKSEKEKMKINDEQLAAMNEILQKDEESRLSLFDKRMENDPFCDEVCSQIQSEFLKQEIRHNKDNQIDDFMNRMEWEKQDMENRKQNMKEEESRREQEDGGGEFFKMTQPPRCQKGQIPIQNRQQMVWECIGDPYQEPPKDFKNCVPGEHWNDRFGHCEPDYKSCPSDQYWDDVKGGCRSKDKPDNVQCAQGEWWSQEQGMCVSDNKTQCPSGQYFDWNTRSCIGQTKPQCGPNEYFDYFEKRCKQDKWQDCPPGFRWEPKTGTCEKNYFTCPPTIMIYCPNGNKIDPSTGCSTGECNPPQKCVNGEYWNEEKQTCEKKVAACAGVLCDDGRCVSDSSQCGQTKPPQMDCSPNGWWDGASQSCQYPQQPYPQQPYQEPTKPVEQPVWEQPVQEQPQPMEQPIKFEPIQEPKPMEQPVWEQPVQEQPKPMEQPVLEQPIQEQPAPVEQPQPVEQPAPVEQVGFHPLRALKSFFGGMFGVFANEPPVIKRR
ncbi:MAG: hypothetical protein HY980_01320 [Candidatus Magasanikbacteria bacterium]|nr:hypothetical protein [Candidatus Magasanikbacteria bacterium]